MNIFTAIFVLVGTICIFKGIRSILKSKHIDLLVIQEGDNLKIDFDYIIQISLGVVLTLLGLIVIPHYIIDKSLRDSLFVSERIVKSFEKDFDIETSSGFAIPIVKPQDTEVSYVKGIFTGHASTGALLFKTKTGRSVLEFAIPEKLIVIKHPNGSQITATKISETPWHMWPWKVKKFTYELH